MTDTSQYYFEKIKQLIGRLCKREGLSLSAETPLTTENAEGLVSFYRGLIKPGDLCFDIGANIGARADIFLKLGAQVVCVEPQPGCVAVLMQKYHNNHRVIVVPKGLAAKAGEMTLSVCTQANTLATFSEKWKTGRFNSYLWESTVNVAVTTLDELIGDYGVPSYCKIDVEGFEYQVLQGLRSPLKFISFEFTKEFLHDASLCMEHLKSLGRVSFNYVLGDNLTEDLKFQLATWADGETVLEKLRSIDSPLLWGDIYASFR
jgi:FkbM family methyltransferase